MKKLIHILFLLLFCLSTIHAQEKVSVVTRKLDKEFAVEAGDHLILNAERGIISIKSWSQSALKVEMRIIAKNSNIEAAREEVQFMEYAIYNRRKEITLRNYLLLPQNKQASELTSILKVEYDIWLPNGMLLDIQNRFGTVTLRNLKTELTAFLEYSDLTLDNTSLSAAEININTGDLVIRNSELDAEIDTRYAVINITESTGKLRLDAEYGSVYLWLNPQLISELNLSRTDIAVKNQDCNEVNFQLEGNYTSFRITRDCYIKQPSFLDSDYNSDAENKKWHYHYLKAKSSPQLKLKADFGTINMD